MGATPQEKIQGGFRPMLEGFKFGKLNDIESFDKLVDDSVAAVFIESIQGRRRHLPSRSEHSFKSCGRSAPNGAHCSCSTKSNAASAGAVTSLHSKKAACSPTPSAWPKASAQASPSARSGSRGLRELFQPGSHGTTFGGNPLASRRSQRRPRHHRRGELIEKCRPTASLGTSELQALDREVSAAHRRHAWCWLHGRPPLHANALQITAAAREKACSSCPAGHNTIRCSPHSSQLRATQRKRRDSRRVFSQHEVENI